MAEKIKVGIIGCGGIANGKHLPALQKESRVEIIAFCDIIEERAQQAKEQFGTPDAKVYTDYRQMLQDPAIQTVHVLTPNRMHAPCTIDALHAGKHVLCEKPMAKTASDARKMVQAAQETGNILTIGYQNRFRKDARYLKALTDRGDLGEIYFAKAHAVRRRAVPTWGVFTNEYEQGGGSLIDIGTHALDLTLWMMDNYRPKAVMGTAFKKLGKIPHNGNAWGDWDIEQFSVEDSAFGYITMQNGAAIFLESSWALNTMDADEAKTTLCGTKAGADMRDGLRINTCDMDTLTTIRPALDGEGVAFFDASKQPEPADLECACFYDAVIDGKPLIVKPEQALVVTEILEAIYQSSQTGKAVYFE